MPVVPGGVDVDDVEPGGVAVVEVVELDPVVGVVKRNFAHVPLIPGP